MNLSYTERATAEVKAFGVTVKDAYNRHPAIMWTLSGFTAVSMYMLRNPIAALAVSAGSVVASAFKASWNYLSGLISSKGAEAASTAGSTLDLNADGVVDSADLALGASEASKQVNSYFTATSAFLISGAVAATYGAYSYFKPAEKAEIPTGTTPVTDPAVPTSPSKGM